MTVRDRLLVDGTAGHLLGLCDEHLRHRGAGGHDPPVSAAVSDAVAADCVPAVEGDGAGRLVDYHLDASSGDGGGEALDRLAHFLRALLDCLLGLQSGVARHGRLLTYPACAYW